MMPTATRRGDGGYTLIELLVVVAIVAGLAALLLTLVNTKHPDVKRTEVIIRTIANALGTAEANRGSAMSPTEHPFAGSQADAGSARFAFVRSDPRWTTPIARTGTALRGVPTPDYLDADQGHLLMASDRFAERSVPLLFGARRQDLGVLQSLRKVVTKYRHLPLPQSTTGEMQPKVISPRTGQRSPAGYQGDVNADFPDTLTPSVAQLADLQYGRLADSKPALDYLFGSSSAKSELSALKALYNSDPALPEDVNRFRMPVEPRTVGQLLEPLAYTDAGMTDSGPTATNAIEPSGNAWYLTAGAGDGWIRYRLAGLAVYDAWGRELMVTANGRSHRIISAGLDGALAVAPGTDETLDTDLVGDLQERLPIGQQDLDGEKDNLQ
jgi:prepilin-type N-terminal cleavage/methylation domain-containing protein